MVDRKHYLHPRFEQSIDGSNSYSNPTTRTHRRERLCCAGKSMPEPCGVFSVKKFSLRRNVLIAH